MHPLPSRHHSTRPRRVFVAGALTGALLVASSTASSQPAGREQTADQQVLHVLNRLAFGPRPGDVQRVRTMGVDAWIEQQLHPERIDDGATDRWLGRFPVLAMSGAELLDKYPPAGVQYARLAAQSRAAGNGNARPELSAADSAAIARTAREGARQFGTFLSARVGRAVMSERQLLEVMTDFWANHFSVFSGKGQLRYDVPSYEAMLREHALGNFRTLLGAVAKSPAMLQYLDQAQSVADSGRRTLAEPRLARGNQRGGALANRPGARARMEQITVGDLLDRNQLPAQQRERLMALPPAQMARIRSMTLAEAQEYLQTLANNPRRPRGINENYARELMELHTLGVDGGYTQQDVMEVARALTGWTLERGPAGRARGTNAEGGFVFRPEVHDAEAKTILGEAFPAGRGLDEGERVLDLLAAHPSTARFIATKLVRRFVSDEPPADLVDRAAATFTRTKGDIREVLRTIITSDAFFADAAFRSKVKTPFELVVSASRALGGTADETPLSSLIVARLGQPIYGRQTPDGWPDVADEWINTGAILNRMNFGLAVGANRLPGARVQQWEVARELSNASTEAQVDGVVRALFGGIVSTETRGVLLTGENPLLKQAGGASDSLFRDSDDDDDMSMRMTPPAGAPRRAPTGGGRRALERRDAMAALPELTGFPKLVGLAIGAPEFQRR
jgi:uncharacterized protein (DUF1800 family)